MVVLYLLLECMDWEDIFLFMYEIWHQGMSSFVLIHDDLGCHMVLCMAHIVNIATGNGLLPDGTKPLFELMLKYISVKCYLKFKIFYSRSFDYVVCKMSAILFGLQCINSSDTETEIFNEN